MENAAGPDAATSRAAARSDQQALHQSRSCGGERMNSGLVSIVGAGPGDPDLLTCRALRRLEAADLVVYDGLVPDAIVRIAHSARHLSASRRVGRGGPSPSAVATVLIDAARLG